MPERSARRRPSPEWTTAQYRTGCAYLEDAIRTAPARDAAVLERFLQELRTAWGRAGVQHGRSPRGRG